MSKKQKAYRNDLKIPRIFIITAKILQFLSVRLAAKYAAFLFTSPYKFKTPKREFHMDKATRQTKITVPAINKEIVVYEYGNSAKKAVLVHGWCGRGTQLVKIADMLLEHGYSTVSFDAPAHGKAPGKRSNMTEFIEALIHIDKVYGPFEIGIGHSLGSMTLLNGINKGVNLHQLVIIGSGDIVSDIMMDFTGKLGLSKHTSEHMKRDFDILLGSDVDTLSASYNGKTILIPTLIVHDKGDMDVPVSAARNIHSNIKNSKLIITNGLGHRKILGDEQVLTEIFTFIQDKSTFNPPKENPKITGY